MDKNSVNLYQTKARAHRLSRSSSNGSAAYNPFRHFARSSKKHPDNLNDAELGHADRNHNLHETTTTHDQANANANGQPNEVYDSQATTAHSPTAGSENGGIRRRGPGAGETDDAFAARGIDSNGEKPKKKEGMFKHPQPKEPYTIRNQLQRTFLNSWINILLLAAPVGIAVWATKLDGRIAFAVNFIAIIPLAAMLSFATEEIALRTGETLGGLINATFGNAVELIVAVIALTQNQVVVVQTSLIGSILSNLLLVLGFCFFCGGINRREQFFNTTVAQTAASLLALAIGSLIVPTVFSHTPDFNDNSQPLRPTDVPQLSHGVAVILLLVYAAYLFFQLKTHSAMFAEESQKVPAKKDMFKRRSSSPERTLARGVGMAGVGATNLGIHNENSDVHEAMTHPPRQVEDEEDEDEGPQLSFTVAVVTLLISTVIIALCAEGLVSGIESIAEEGVSEEFIGLILIPIVGNAAEHATAVTVAIKDKMDLAIGVAVGSSMQVALFLIPLLVIIGWGMGNNDMTLAFDTFQIVVLFVAVLLVNYLIGDGKSHWLEGALLIALYIIIAVCAFFYPNPTNGESAVA